MDNFKQENRTISSVTSNRGMKLHPREFKTLVAGEECDVQYWSTNRSLLHVQRHAKVTCPFGSSYHRDRKSFPAALKRCKEELGQRKSEGEFLEKLRFQEVTDNGLEFTGEIWDAYRTILGVDEPQKPQKNYINELNKHYKYN